MDADHSVRLIKQLIRRYSPCAADILTRLQTDHSDYVAYRAGAYLLYLKSTLNTNTLREPRQMRPAALTENPNVAALVDQAAACLVKDMNARRR